jgi:hypothetical protein
MEDALIVSDPVTWFVQNGRSSLGDVLYRSLCSDNFSTEVFLSKLDTSDEHNILDVANRLETAILVWGQQTRLRNARLWAKEKKFNAKSSWGKMREFVGDVDRRLLLADRVERVLVGLKQQVPGLPQTSLDTNKILFNRVQISKNFCKYTNSLCWWDS